MNIRVFTIAFNGITGSFNTKEIESFFQSNHIIYQQAAFFTEKSISYWSVLICYEAGHGPLYMANTTLSQPSPNGYSLVEKQIVTDEIYTTPKAREKAILPILTEEEKELYDKLKQWRKHKAQAKGFPVYLLATNNQLLQMVQQKVTTKNSLQAIKGFGKQRTAQYGEDIINIIKEHANLLI